MLAVIGNRETIKRILVCSGGEKYIDRAVEFSGALAKAAGASITLFHVMAEPPAVYTDLIRMEEDVNLLLHSSSGLGQNLRREKELLEVMGVLDRGAASARAGDQRGVQGDSPRLTTIWW